MPRDRLPWRERRSVCSATRTSRSAREWTASGRLEIEAPQGHPEFSVAIDAGSKYLINPGSVGQPRDGDSRAAYAIADLDRNVVTLYRVAYPIEAAQKKILDAGFRRCWRTGSEWDGS